MTSADNANATSDPWLHWLTHGRHGGDPNLQAAIRHRVESIRDRVLHGAHLREGMTLLDVGAGDGLIGFGAIAQIGDSLNVIFADISAPSLRHMEELARQQHVSGRCTFVEATAERLHGVADAAVDVVSTRAVLAYVADKPAAAHEFHRVLKPGGRVSLAEPICHDDAYSLAHLAQFLATRPADATTLDARLFLRWKGAQLPDTAEAIIDNPLTNFTERDLFTIFEAAGFVETHLELHIDTHKLPVMPWENFLDIAHHPAAPTLREVLTTRFTTSERDHFETGLRPSVEAGQIAHRDAIAYLTAVKSK